MFRTLHGKLSLALLVLFIPIGIFYVWSTVATSRHYAQELSQEANAGLAARLVREHDLMVDSSVDTAALAPVVETLAMTNPDVDLYVLDPAGEVLQTSVPTRQLELERVSLGPVQAFLNGAVAYPVLGDNPRAAARSKVFSVASIPTAGPLEGYLYIVLADEAQDTIAAMVESSTIVRLSIGVGLALFILVFLAGILSFTLITRRLKRLAQMMTTFHADNFAGTMVDVARAPQAGDEVAELNRVFYRMAERIAEQVSRLKENDRLRRELVANVSHDLRTPLTALQGYLETLQLGTLGPTEKQHYLDLAVKHSVRLGRLVGDLVELAKLEANAAPLHKEAFPLAELVQDVVQKFQLGAEQRRVTLVADIKLHPTVSLDVQFIERVFENLIDNALQHTPPGGKVTLSLRPLQRGVTVVVADTGSGIAEAELPSIFERYYRASRTAETGSADSAGSAGVGLGLAISQHILELHGSHLTVTSKLGVGTTFSFDLPIS